MIDQLTRRQAARFEAENITVTTTRTFTALICTNDMQHDFTERLAYGLLKPATIITLLLIYY